MSGSSNQIKMLMKNKPYKMLGMVETKHSEYGDGQCATLMCPLGKKLRTQLPKKYLAQLSRDDLRTIKGDIIDGKPIFLVFREIMADNSYRIDMTEAGEGWIKSFDKNEEGAELEDSMGKTTRDKRTFVEYFLQLLAYLNPFKGRLH